MQWTVCQHHGAKIPCFFICVDGHFLAGCNIGSCRSVIPTTVCISWHNASQRLLPRPNQMYQFAFLTVHAESGKLNMTSHCMMTHGRPSSGMQLRVKLMLTYLSLRFQRLQRACSKGQAVLEQGCSLLALHYQLHGFFIQDEARQCSCHAEAHCAVALAVCGVGVLVQQSHDSWQ